MENCLTSEIFTSLDSIIVDIYANICGIFGCLTKKKPAKYLLNYLHELYTYRNNQSRR